MIFSQKSSNLLLFLKIYLQNIYTEIQVECNMKTKLLYNWVIHHKWMITIEIKYTQYIGQKHF